MRRTAPSPRRGFARKDLAWDYPGQVSSSWVNAIYDQVGPSLRGPGQEGACLYFACSAIKQQPKQLSWLTSIDEGCTHQGYPGVG